MRKLTLCVRTLVSVAIRIPGWGYKVHGHDVEVEACFSSVERIDIETLRSLLTAIASQFDHKPLWETIGEGALIEDMLSEICKALRERAPSAVRLEQVEAKFPGARIIADCA